jgi:hypothetical protein
MERDRSKVLRGAAVLAAALSVATAPASANDFFGGIGFGFGNAIGHMLFQPYRPRYQGGYRYEGGGRRTHSHAAGGGGGARAPSAAQDEALASLGANKDFDTILSEVTFKSVEASAGSDDSQKFGHKGDALNVKVDLPTERANFVNDVQTMAKDFATVGDVSLAAVESALDEVYDAREQEDLRKFETLQGMNFTAEDFKVEIVREAHRKLAKFKSGNSRGMVQLGQIKQIFAESAHDVFLRTFEVAELMAMNAHLAEFDRELYETGDALPADAPPPASAPLKAAADSADNDPYPGDAPTPSPAANAKPMAGADSADNDPYPGAAPAPSPSPAAKPAAEPAEAAAKAEPVSKMRHITAETLRLAQLLANDIPFEQTREVRESLFAFRYRLTRATLDCFMQIATQDPGAEPPTPVAQEAAAGRSLTPEEKAAERENRRYEDLVRQFMVSIARRDSAAAPDTGGAAAANSDGACRKGAMRLAGLDPDAPAGSSPRDLSKLRQPESALAVWGGKDWRVEGPATARP